MSLSHFGSTVLLIEQLELCVMEEQRFIKQYISYKSMRSALLCSIVDVKNETLYQCHYINCSCWHGIMDHNF